MNKRHKILMGLLVLLCGCGGEGGKTPVDTLPETEAAGGASAQEEPRSEEETEPIYITFEGTDLEGNPVSQDIFSQSRLTMVNVWATYCNLCLNEMPGLGELAAKHDGSEFQLSALSATCGRETTRRL